MNQSAATIWRSLLQQMVQQNESDQDVTDQATPAHSISTRVDSAKSVAATTTRSSGRLLVQAAIARRRVLRATMS
jgi:hypothetical protein